MNTAILVASFLTGMAASSASAQTLTALVGLGSTTNGSLIQGKDGKLYGATYNGIYKISLDGTVTIPAVMNGLLPNKLVQASDGNFYGTTSNGPQHTGWKNLPTQSNRSSPRVSLMTQLIAERGNTFR
jgi:hypothetical protein